MQPMLPPDNADASFSEPFSLMNRTHAIKLGTAGVVSQLLDYFMTGPGGSARMAPTSAELDDRVAADNERKLRAIYVGHRDGIVLLPSEISEQEARDAIDRARKLTIFATGFLDWTADLPAALLAGRQGFWDQMAAAWNLEGFDAMAQTFEAMFSGLSEDDRTEIAINMRATASGQLESGTSY
jgi:hypothetical protein